MASAQDDTKAEIDELRREVKDLLDRVQALEKTVEHLRHEIDSPDIL